MEVEYRHESGCYFPASVSQVNGDSLLLHFKDAVFEDKLVPITHCRFIKTSPTEATENLIAGDVVDVLFCQPNSDKKAYQRAKVREIKGNFAVVETIEGNAANDVVSIDLCRRACKSQMLSRLCSKSIALTSDLANYADEVCKFIDEGVSHTLAQYNEEKKTVHVYALDSKTIRMLDAATSMLISQVRQKVQLLQKCEEVTKKLEQSAISSKPMVEFAVARELMGLAIGSEGSNIKLAREMPDIVSVTIDESRETKDCCYFKIVAETEEAAENARAILEYKTDVIKVPADMVGKVIGKSGRTIQDIVDRAGAIRVQIGDPVVDDSGAPAGEVDFYFTGTQEAIGCAGMLINMQTKHFREMENIRSTIDETQRRLHPTGDFSGFYNRNRGGPYKYLRNERQRVDSPQETTNGRGMHTPDNNEELSNESNQGNGRYKNRRHQPNSHNSNYVNETDSDIPRGNGYRGRGRIRRGRGSANGCSD